MKFTRLRLLGFKSFVEPGEFVIERGLTGVVGPNGCGKSNLVEALRWVMGESSYKNMRASGMDEVIFSGSGTRPARNTAEVTLFLDNADRTAPAAFNDADELQVSRRIEREAGSVYRINGREARARDVQLLFADQSTGARSPSMVGQGRVSELIQAKPQARRALLEEAAGISGLHTRRHEAELRLRAAEQNLERLDDVVGELGSQVESLKRQARQASRFKNLSADIRSSEAVLLHLRWTLAKAQAAEAQSALAAATSLVAERAAAQIEAAREQAVSALRLPELRDAEARAAAAFQRLSVARAQLDEEAERLRARHAELSRRMQQFEADIEREERMLGDNAEILERLAAEEAKLVAENASAGEREAAARSQFEKAVAVVPAGEAALARLTAERAEATAQKNQLERRLRETAERRGRLESQLAVVDREAEGLELETAGLADPLERKAVVEAARAALAAAETEAGRAEKAVAQARAAESAARPPLNEAKAGLARIETEARTLSKILGAVSSGRFPAVVEEIAVERGFETALGAALGDDLDAALESEAPVHWAESGAADADPALPAGVECLATRVKAPDRLSRRLRQLGVVAEADGPRLQKLLLPGQRLVSRQGALWRWDGLTASADAPTAAAQRLAQKNRLAELDAEAAAAAGRLRSAEAGLEAAEAALRREVAAEAASRQAWREAQQALGTAVDAFQRAEKAASELTGRRAVLEEARSRLAGDLEEAGAARADAEAQLSSAPDPGELGRRLDEAAAEVARDRATLADARVAHEGLKREAEARQRRLQAIETERGSWMLRAENAAAQIAALGGRREEALQELEHLADAPDEIEARRRALLTQLSQAEELRKAAADRLQQAETRQAGLDGAAGAAVQHLSEAREARARAEERLGAAEERRGEIEARIQSALGTPAHLAIRQTGLAADAEMPDVGDVERRLERLKVERERLGAVNLRADEEQKELSERLEAIVTDREDVIEAIRKLRQAIQNLNREGRERLLGAFDIVNGHFQKLFTHLFGGGTAELQLIESDDPLEAGLEILARPPGKKPQTMTLLSGGEQALTAMALIFAVFLTNPAPICVLDEVDAPLDDHNVERFCDLMDEMARSTETRFVIITHNPITMARMNRLFGVTMAEQGVSQLVSVELAVAEQLAEAS